MKKLSKKKKWYLTQKNRRFLRKQHKLSIREKNKKKLLHTFRALKRFTNNTENIRSELTKNLYKKKNWNEELKVVNIENEFGIESDFSGFINKASTLIDFNSTSLKIDLTECQKLLPSATTLLCSLMQWVELRSTDYKRPNIMSTYSKFPEVNLYLNRSGFHYYVNRKDDIDTKGIDNSDIVKIQRENHNDNIEDREIEIMKLIAKYSYFNKDELELFDDVILTEAFNNVSEHGVSNRDSGWWVHAQYCIEKNYISLCIADNGIGIRNSLITGPQRDMIKRKLHNSETQDGEFIKLALEENVSGAIAAPQKNDGIFFKKYESGARRGNGLKRIRQRCEELEISFSIISHFGYIIVDKEGEILECGTKNNRVFAGTMYNFIIDCSITTRRNYAAN